MSAVQVATRHPAAALTRPSVVVARGVLVLAPLTLSLALWFWALGTIDVSHLGKHGLPPALPISWYAAVAILIASACVLCWSERPSGWLIAVYVGALVLVINETVPILADVPHYPWVYKHIGVTRFIDAHGGVAPNVDIYNRWPGFFAAAAAYCRWAGVDPMAVAAWAEPAFALVETLMVAAVALGVTRKVGIAGFAALMFTVGNWISQTYFAPQTLAYTMALAMFVVITRQFLPGDAPRWVARLIGIVTRRPQQPAQVGAEPLPWRAGWSIALLLLLDAGVIITHQLTPYVLLMQMGVMTVLGFARPRWLVIAMGVLTVAYLVPNYDYVEKTFGLFTGLNAADNIKPGESTAAHLSFYYRHAGGILSVILITLMLLSGVRLAFAGSGTKALALIALALTPFAILFAQNYGGEASLRVFLFSSPWRDVVIAMGVATITSRRIRIAGSIAVCFALLVFFMPAFYGKEELYMIPKGEVTASEFFYAHAPADSVLVLSAPSFPTRAGARYSVMKGPQADDGPNLTGNVAWQDRPLGTADVPAVIEVMQQYAKHGFIEFSTGSYRYNELYALTPSGQLQNLEAALASSSAFRLWYSGPDARIYRWTGR